MTPFLKNMGWLGAAEFFSRIMRLGTTVVVARSLSTQEYGMAATVMVLSAFMISFSMRSGIGNKLIQAPTSRLDEFCQTAYSMGWLSAFILALTQILLSIPISLFYHNPQIIGLNAVMSLSLLFNPLYHVQCVLIYRENALRTIALCNLLESFVCNIATIILALLGWGAWALILPLVLTVPIWCWVMWSNQDWRPNWRWSFSVWREIFPFAFKLLGIDLLAKLRDYIDYIAIGVVLGPEALGLYYFAFNAGLGLSTGMIQSVSGALYPHLSTCGNDRNDLIQRYLKSLQDMAKTIVPLILIQSILAPIYVPIIFGPKWVAAIPMVVLICLSAVPRPFANATSFLLQLSQNTAIDLKSNLIFTVFFSVSVVIAVQFGIVSVAIAVFMTHASMIPGFIWWVQQRDYQIIRSVQVQS